MAQISDTTEMTEAAVAGHQIMTWTLMTGNVIESTNNKCRKTTIYKEGQNEDRYHH